MNGYSAGGSGVYAARRPVKKRRRRRSGVAGAVIFILLFLCGLLFGACFLLYTRIPKPRRDMMGEWSAAEDLTGQAIDLTQIWLNGAALGDNISARERFDEASAKLVLDTRLRLYNNGGYELNVDADSYERAKNKASAAAGEALIDLIALRARAAGLDDAASDREALRSAFYEAFGLEPREYIRLNGPRLLPELSEIQEGRDKKGRFNLDADNALVIWDGERRDAFVLNGDLLLLRGGGLNGELADADGRIFFNRVGDSDDEASLKDIFAPLRAEAREHRITENLLADTGNGAAKVVKAIHSEYKNNRFLSLRDIAGALQGTKREFSLSVGNNGITIDTGGTWQAVGGENEPFSEDDSGALQSWTTNDLKSNAMTIDGRSVKYYTFLANNTDGKRDCFINITDLALLLDINISVSEGTLYIDTSERGLVVDMEALKESGFYDEMKSAVLGDATTGEIFAGSMEDQPVPIASTTKLLSYAVIMDAMAAGEIGMGDTVTISAAVAELSQGPDRVIPMEEGELTDVNELLHAMLIASSNESAMALAEHVAGSEAAFVERMKKKAEEIGFKDEYAFYNCHGLPVFADDISTAKQQNHMSARDMLLLVSHILNVYPQITDITSMKTDSLYTLKMDIKTTNALLYNMPDAVGLKTGTTNMAGACLVAAVRADGADGRVHYIVSVVFGAEDNTVRFTSSALMLNYGKQLVAGGAAESAPDTEVPTDAESVVRRVIEVIRAK